MKKEKKERNIIEDNDNYVSRFIFTIFITLILLVLSYLFIGKFVNKTLFVKDDKKEEKEEATIDNETILMGEIFDQKDSEYYVLIYDKSNNNDSLDNYKKVYESSDNSLAVYTVDSSLNFNSKYIVKNNSNTKPTSYKDLRVKAPTLIKISNKKVTEYIEGYDNIKNTFNK